MATTTQSATFHGVLGSPTWKLPKVIAESTLEARPGYNTCTASEFQDVPAVLSAKVDCLAAMIKQSSAFVVYTGAGVSTAAGLGDYASKATGSIAGRENSSGNRLKAQPTTAHRLLAGMEKKGLLKHWINQNHDGLAQKAGYPQAKLNEIHGSWFDKKNPVVLMDDCLKPANHKWLREWEQQADLCLAMGTSLCGMTSDCVAETTGKKGLAAIVALQQQSNTAEGEEEDESGVSPLGTGLVIVNLQQTKMDHLAALRIFAPCDTVMAMLAKRLGVKPGGSAAVPPAFR
eukprot:TRINITY_DN2287_c0_g1_i1.p1 TRINITY_DN2287_c0_g1~~TRINITY_DN2287_c0_g1_i1.p1  ORF type:complete len:288 (+),score=42.23 TRINITY_DN2287_c0_g1_i1:65-928(+)